MAQIEKSLKIFIKITNWYGYVYMLWSVVDFPGTLCAIPIDIKMTYVTRRQVPKRNFQPYIPDVEPLIYPNRRKLQFILNEEQRDNDKNHEEHINDDKINQDKYEVNSDHRNNSFKDDFGASNHNNYYSSKYKHRKTLFNLEEQHKNKYKRDDKETVVYEYKEDGDDTYTILYDSSEDENEMTDPEILQRLSQETDSSNEITEKQNIKAKKVGPHHNFIDGSGLKQSIRLVHDIREAIKGTPIRLVHDIRQDDKESYDEDDILKTDDDEKFEQDSDIPLNDQWQESVNFVKKHIRRYKRQLPPPEFHEGNPSLKGPKGGKDFDIFFEDPALWPLPNDDDDFDPQDPRHPDNPIGRNMTWYKYVPGYFEVDDYQPFLWYKNAYTDPHPSGPSGLKILLAQTKPLLMNMALARGIEQGPKPAPYRTHWTDQQHYGHENVPTPGYTYPQGLNLTEEEKLESSWNKTKKSNLTEEQELNKKIGAWLSGLLQGLNLTLEQKRELWRIKTNLTYPEGSNLTVEQKLNQTIGNWIGEVLNFTDQELNETINIWINEASIVTEQPKPELLLPTPLPETNILPRIRAVEENTKTFAPKRLNWLHKRKKQKPWISRNNQAKQLDSLRSISEEGKTIQFTQKILDLLHRKEKERPSISKTNEDREEDTPISMSEEERKLQFTQKRFDRWPRRREDRPFIYINNEDREADTLISTSKDDKFTPKRLVSKNKKNKEVQSPIYMTRDGRILDPLVARTRTSDWDTQMMTLINGAYVPRLGLEWIPERPVANEF